MGDTIRFSTPGAFGDVDLLIQSDSAGYVHFTLRFSDEYGGVDQRNIILDSSGQAMLAGWLMASLSKSGALSFTDELKEKVRKVAEREA